MASTFCTHSYSGVSCGVAAIPPLQLVAIKEKMAVVLRKTKNDDRLITALRAELAAAVQAGGGGRHIRASVTGVERCALVSLCMVYYEGAAVWTRTSLHACMRCHVLLRMCFSLQTEKQT